MTSENESGLRTHAFQTLLEDATDHVTFSPDGRFLAVLSDRVIRILDAFTHEQLQVLDLRGGLFQKAAFSEDGEHLAVAEWGQNRVLIWEVASGTLIRELAGHTDMVLDVAFVPGRREVISASRDTTLRHWNWQSGELLRQLIGHARPVMCVRVSEDGSLIASGSADGTARVWSVDSGQVMRLFRTRLGVVSGIDFDMAAQRMAVGGGHHVMGEGARQVEVGGLVLYAVQENRRLYEHLTQAYVINAVVLSREGTAVFAGDSAGSLHLFEGDTGEEIVDFSLEDDNGSLPWLTSLALHPLGDQLAIASGNGVLLYGPIGSEETLSDVRLQDGHSAEVTALSLSPDESMICSCAADGTVRLWDVNEGRLLDVLGGEDGPATTMALCPVTGRLAVAHRRGIENRPVVCVWSPGQSRTPRVMYPGQVVSALAFSPEGGRLAVGTEDGQVSVYDTDTWWRVSVGIEHSGLWHLTFTGDGEHLVTSAHYPETRIRTWDVATSQLRWEVDLSVLSGYGAWANHIAVDPQGERVAWAEEGGSVRVWSLRERRELLRLEGHTGNVWRVQFSGDGQTLVSGAWDRTVRLWDLVSGREICRLRVGDHVLALAVSRNLSKVLAGDRSGDVHLWRLWQFNH